MEEVDAIDAVNARLAEVYPGQQPRHFGTIRRFAEGGSDPLDGISVYSGEPDYWHFVSFGMSPWACEFSLRVVRREKAEPPRWPLAFLQHLARYVYNTGDPFGPEHYVSWGGPITAAEPTELVALMFAEDAELGSVNVGEEQLTFLTPIGITAAEYEVCAQDRPETVLVKLLAANPLGVVDLQRGRPPEPVEATSRNS